MAPGPAALGARALNHALERAPWARDKLAVHAGRRVNVQVGPLDAAFRIESDGLVAPVERGGPAPDLQLRLSPLNVSSFLADPRRWNELVTEEGDVALGGTLKELAQVLPWFVEDTFARTFGDVLGTRIASVGKQLLSLPGHAAERLAGSAATYARDEANLLARGDDMRRFADQAAALAVRAAALDARLDALDRNTAASTVAPLPASTFVGASAASASPA